MTAGDGTTVVYDVGDDSGEGGELVPAGCAAQKIDLLFVISRSGPMQFYQDQLLAAFPKFIATIETKFADFDYQIMVIDSDGKWGSLICEPQCDEDGFCVATPEYPCDLRHLVTPCDRTRGAGRIFNAGFFATNTPCAVPGGRRYLAKGDPNLSELFTCVAQVGTAGYNFVGESVTAAMKPAINAADGCNAGFLREDALLMITFIGAYDYLSKDDPGTWSANILKAKGGDLRSVVMLSILDPECYLPEDRICQLVKKYPYHALSDLDDSDYSKPFDEAVDLVALACTEPIPG